VSAALFSHHYARFTLCRSSFRCSLLDFIEAVVSSSNCFRAKTVADASKEEDGETISVLAMQKYREKHTNF
jgi:hypothetical protein